MPRIRPVDLVDVLAYVLVLGAFVQLFPRVISESFLITVLTAILLKLVLELVLWAKKAAVSRVRGAESPRARLVGIALLVVLLPGSKFVVLLLTDLIFGDAVHLGGFFPVTLLIVTLMAARAGLRRLVDRGPAA